MWSMQQVQSMDRELRRKMNVADQAGDGLNSNPAQAQATPSLQGSLLAITPSPHLAVMNTINNGVDTPMAVPPCSQLAPSSMENEHPNTLFPAPDTEDSRSSKRPKTTHDESSTVPTASSHVESVPPTKDEKLESVQENEPRRSGREKKSTLVYINGQAVLAKNNYQLKGLSYQYGTDFDSAPPPTKKKKTTTKLKEAATATAKPRPVTTVEKKRLDHNATVQQRVTSKKELRTQYLASNLESMKPFLQDRIADELNKAAGTSAAAPRELFAQPDSIQADMRDYQLDGLNWMVKMNQSNLGMILGDEMGLGKTLQTISLLCHLKEREGVTGPSLVICPLSVLYSWCRELERWAPSLSFLRLHSSSSEEREAQKRSFIERATDYDVVVTTYEMAKAPGLRSLWSRQHFNYVVLDEGHRIKDVYSQISQAVRLIHCENKMILTGTPLQNNLVELWSLLNCLYPDVFVANDKFAEAFNLTENKIDKEKLLQAHELLSLFMLRRLKDEVEKLMPKKVETKVFCPLSNTQVFWYKALLLKDINLLARISADDSDSPSATGANKLNNLVMQLRKCCLHPFLFEGAEVDIDSTTCEDLIAASGKLAVLDMLLRSLYEKNHRVVLFSQFTSVLDILDDYCSMRQFKHCRFDGGTARAKRNYIINQFNAPDSDYFVFLMSTRSGGMGINLQTADTVVLFDSDWNPQPDIQAAARVHRIGQTKTVHVYRLVCKNTIEERIVERADRKLFMDQMVNQDSAAGGELNVSKNKLMATLRFGCDAVFGEDSENQNALPTAEDIEAITDRSRSESFSDGKLKGGTTNTASEFKADDAFTATTKLGGIDFKKIRDDYHKKKLKDAPKDVGGISYMWMKLHEKRKRKNRIVNVEAEGSGYGSKSVPVLATNNYDLENGEKSVFQRELGGRKGNFGEVKRTVKKSGVHFEVQDFCQVCGDGGTLLCCPRCPVCVHKECVGVVNPKDFLSCPHHRCSHCGKNTSAAGGLLYPCQSCPQSFCEDCLPTEEKGFRILESCERFTQLGFHSHYLCYVNCSEHCEEYAKIQFQWKLPSTKRPPVPAAFDLSHAFCKPIDAAIDMEEEAICETRLRKKKLVNYAELNTAQGAAAAPPAALKTGAPTASRPPLRPSEYEVVLPITQHGLLIEVRGSKGYTVFCGYRQASDGTKGVAERTNCIRNMGDRIVAVNHVGTTCMPHRQVVSLLLASRSKKYVVLRFEDIKHTNAIAKEPVLPSVPEGSPVPPAALTIKSPGELKYNAVLSDKDVITKTRVALNNSPSGKQVSDSDRQAAFLSNAQTVPPAGLIPTAAALPKQPNGAVLPSSNANEDNEANTEVVNLTMLEEAEDPTPPQSPSNEYDAILPITTQGLGIVLGDVNGKAIFTKYTRLSSGIGPAEACNLIRNKGDAVIAVNGVEADSFQQVCQLVRESKANSSKFCCMRLRETGGDQAL